MHLLNSFNDRRKSVMSNVKSAAQEIGDRVAGYQPGQRKQESANLNTISKSKMAFQQLHGSQTEGDWSNPTSDWNEAMAQKESHNW